MVYHAIIPARFLSLTAHLVLTIMLYWSRVSLFGACVNWSLQLLSETSCLGNSYTPFRQLLLIAGAPCPSLYFIQ